MLTAKRACRHPGCPGLTTRQYCDTHAHEQAAYDDACSQRRKAAYKRLDERRGTAQERGYDATWAKLRGAVRDKKPLCADCLSRGRTTPAVDYHHVVEISNGGERLSESNIMPLCKKHHMQRHHKRRTRRGE